MLITNAEIYGADHSGLQDLRIIEDRIAAIGQLTPQPNEVVLDAAGAALLPGLHDHHIHLLSYAASLRSIRCGPPDVHDGQALIDAARGRPGSGWLRGYGYHESVAGDIDRHWLDAHLPARPIRIQHRSGRLWILNSPALDLLTRRQQENDSSRLTVPADGRLFDADGALGTLLGRELPPVAEASRMLASYGVTGITDMTPGNDAASLDLIAELLAAGDLQLDVLLAGAAELPFPASRRRVATGATKIHLHDSALPEFSELCAIIRRSHADDRPIAVHCVTEVELVFTLAAIEEAGPAPGDRIEHASVTPPALLQRIAQLGLTVVTQPNFLFERGDAYLRDLPATEHGWLYRARAFTDHGIPLAGGTDAPFGQADPWIAIRSAVHRRTAEEQAIGPEEALTPEQALALFLGCPAAPTQLRALAPGATADLCLLTVPWADAREVLDRSLVRATFASGTRTY